MVIEVCSAFLQFSYNIMTSSPIVPQDLEQDNSDADVLVFKKTVNQFLN